MAAAGGAGRELACAAPAARRPVQPVHAILCIPAIALAAAADRRHTGRSISTSGMHWPCTGARVCAFLYTYVILLILIVVCSTSVRPPPWQSLMAGRYIES